MNNLGNTVLIIGSSGNLGSELFKINSKFLNPSKKNLNITKISDIKKYVDRFIQFAKDSPKNIFLVTEVGCGLAGFDPKFIAPLFKDAVKLENVHLPANFWNYLK